MPRQETIRNPGQMTVVRGQRAVCSTDHPIVTDAVLRVLRDGGTAIDAAIVACLLQTTIEPFMTNLAGSVTLLYWHAATGTLHALDAVGTFAGELPLFKPIPASVGGFAGLLGHEPSATIPGFMPGLKAMHERFGTKPWGWLCEEPIFWAREGHPVSSFEHSVTDWNLGFATYFPEGRALFLEDGFVRPVGARFRNADLANTLEAIGRDGPDHMITGAWAQSFVEKANALGWAITLDHLTANPPRWSDPLVIPHGDFEVAQLPLPQVEAVMSAIVLGVLANIEGATAQPDSADAIYAMAHALRLASQHVGFVSDPNIFDTPIDTLLDPGYHQHLARLIARSRPRTDLRRHIEITRGPARMHAAGAASRSLLLDQRSGSCELAIIDPAGNWVQMINTLQTGGIPGMVIGGVPMVGSHATTGVFNSGLDAVLAPQARMRSIVGNTMVLRGGRPVFSLGTPGLPHFTVPQVLANIISRAMAYEDAVRAPRMWALGDDYTLTIENRLTPSTIGELTSLGIVVVPSLDYDWHFGSFQLAWRDANGTVGALSDLRRCGIAGGIPNETSAPSSH